MARRNILRPAPAPERLNAAVAQRLRSKLTTAETALKRWQARLKRAFNAVEKHQRTAARLERQLSRLE